ncbi:1,4-alpha-glucan branching enzyme, partial [Pseudomonas aeruginosa]
IGSSGIWERFIPGLARGEIYKYHLVSRHNGYTVDKADPYGFQHEVPPNTGSVIWDLNYSWGDEEWLAKRGQRNALG